MRLLLLAALTLSAFAAGPPALFIRGTLTATYRVHRLEARDPAQLTVKLTTSNEMVQGFSVTVKFTNGRKKRYLVQREDYWCSTASFWLPAGSEVRTIVFDELGAISSAETEDTTQ
ncbi:MAG TPA: hypothetical protein VN428_02405 [Bryobacteraceae bacterium]|nr:hypothetical protein [Bryobacteraceae bacterium]